MAINKTTQYTTDPNSIPVSISTGEQTLDDALEQRLTVSATEPSETFAHQRWWDTSIDQLKERNGANTAWIVVADIVAGELVPHAGGAQVPQISGGADANFTAMPQVGGDPVVESGSNTDGDWTKFADGTQRVHQRQSGTYGTGTTSWSWTFPLAFFVGPQVFAQYLGGGSGAVRAGLEFVSNTTSTGFVHNDSGGSRNESLCLAAHGRWK